MDEDYLVIQRQDGVLQGRALIWFGRERKTGDNIYAYISVCGSLGKSSSLFDMTAPMVFDNSNRSFRHSKNIVYLDDLNSNKLIEQLDCDITIALNSYLSINRVAWSYVMQYKGFLTIALYDMKRRYNDSSYPESELDILSRTCDRIISRQQNRKSEQNISEREGLLSRLRSRFLS